MVEKAGKGLLGTNALAYLALTSVMKKKNYIIDTGCQSYKTFLFSFVEAPGK
jgi:hypothetical protein